MKLNHFVAVLGLGLLVGGAALADPVEGVWQTEVDDGSYALVTITPCGPNFCGVISRTFNNDGEYQSENLGRMIVIDMAPKGEGSYEGQVWRPSNDKIYYGTIALSGDKLKLAGCVAGGLICAKQNWSRVE